MVAGVFCCPVHPDPPRCARVRIVNCSIFFVAANESVSYFTILS